MFLSIILFMSVCICIIAEKMRYSENKKKETFDDFFLKNRFKDWNNTYRHLRLPWTRFVSKKFKDVAGRTAGYIIIDKFFFRFGEVHSTSGCTVMVEPIFKNWKAGLSIGASGTSGEQNAVMHKYDDDKIKVKYNRCRKHFYWIVWGIIDEHFNGDDLTKNYAEEKKKEVSNKGWISIKNTNADADVDANTFTDTDGDGNTFSFENSNNNTE